MRTKVVACALMALLAALGAPQASATPVVHEEVWKGGGWRSFVIYDAPVGLSVTIRVLSDHPALLGLHVYGADGVRLLTGWGKTPGGNANASVHAEAVDVDHAVHVKAHPGPKTWLGVAYPVRSPQPVLHVIAWTAGEAPTSWLLVESPSPVELVERDGEDASVFAVATHMAGTAAVQARAEAVQVQASTGGSLPLHVGSRFIGIVGYDQGVPQPRGSTVLERPDRTEACPCFISQLVGPDAVGPGEHRVTFSGARVDSTYPLVGGALVRYTPPQRA